VVLPRSLADNQTSTAAQMNFHRTSETQIYGQEHS
jgi:hypothetical protein